MHIQIKKPFLETAISPIAFQQNEFVNVPDSIAKKLIKSGHAVAVEKIQTPPTLETR